MEKDAALHVVNHDFVGGKIMWLPHKREIPPEHLPALGDMEITLFNHPVVIISENVKRTENDMVDVLVMTTFHGDGLLRTCTRLDNPVLPLLYAPVHPAPIYPNVLRRTISLKLAEYDGNEKTFKHSWVNMRRSYSIPFKCLDIWQKWKGHKTPILEKESYGDLMRYLRDKVPSVRTQVEKDEQRKEEERKREEERWKKKKDNESWRPRQQPQLSKSIEEMIRDYRYGTRKLEEERKKAESRWRARKVLEKESWRNPETQSPQQSRTQIAGQNVQGRSRAATTISDDPPKSKSMSSAMIPGPGSYIHKAEEEGKKKENERSKPSRGSESQPLQQPGAETPGDDVQPTTSETLSFIDPSATPCQKPLVLATLKELAMARIDVLWRHIGMRGALASGDPEASIGTMVFASWVPWHLPMAPPGMTIEDSYDILDMLGHPLPR